RRCTRCLGRASRLGVHRRTCCPSPCGLNMTNSWPADRRGPAVMTCTARALPAPFIACAGSAWPPSRSSARRRWWGRLPGGRRCCADLVAAGALGGVHGLVGAVQGILDRRAGAGGYPDADRGGEVQVTDGAEHPLGDPDGAVRVGAVEEGAELV